MDRFLAARLKVEWAKKHILDVGKIVSALPDAYVSTIEPNVHGGQSVKYVRPDVGEIGVTMALTVGDAIHNLRVAMEYAYLGAIEKHIPTLLKRQPPFPTGETREKVEERLKKRKIDILGPKLFDGILARVKPYVEGGNCLIKMLHDLDVSDKHWLLIPVVRVATISDIIVEDEEGRTVTGNTYPIHGDGPYFINFGPKHKVKDKGKLTLEVVFDEINIPLLENMPVMSDLEDFSKTATYVIQVLESI
jgi:hypothetical protein